MKRKLKTTTKLWIGIGALALLCPVGLALPEWLKAGNAWGEWGPDELKKIVGYVPTGLEKLSSLWAAALPDYAFKGNGNANPGTSGFGALGAQYIASAVIGIALCVGGTLLLGKILAKKKQ